mmetsp:Transcript_96728/g.167899  ORF Transcript_96728/g.167899 Transcript_96728/m.167899 type:complete len:450 (+) Transcript_96728:80-1429(+)
MSRSALRSVLRELRQFDGPNHYATVSAARATRALLAPEVLNALTGGPKGSLYRPVAPSLQSSSSASLIDDHFRLWVRQHLREQGAQAKHLADEEDDEPDMDWLIHGEDHVALPNEHIEDAGDGALAMAAVGVATTVMRSPLPHCQSWQPSSSQLGGLHVVENPGNIMKGDYLLGHPSLAEDGIGGCVAIVLRHSRSETLCLLLNVNADVLDDADAQLPNSPQSMLGHLQSPMHPRRLGRMPRRPHVCLPPLAAHDPRQVLPEQLRSSPLRYGGAHPAPLHLLHSTPLKLTAPMEQQQRLVGWEVRPGLWCSYVDEQVANVAREALEHGKAVPQQFGAFVGMIAYGPGDLANSVLQNHWIPVRPLARDAWHVPPQGWVASVAASQDDRHWGSWRDLLSSIGGEYAEWAKVDWMRATQTASNPFGVVSELPQWQHPHYMQDGELQSARHLL